MEGESSGVQQAQGQVEQGENQRQGGQEPGVDARSGQKQDQQEPQKDAVSGENIELATGDWLRVSPAAHRQFRAASDSDITYVCIQVKQGSLDAFTADDAIML